MSLVVFDASEAIGARLRGWSRYAAELAAALRARDAGDDGGDGGLRYRVVAGRLRGPEMLWEQVGLPLVLRRVGAAVVHAPNCFLALRRPCRGVVTVHDLAFERHPGDFLRTTGAKYRYFAPRAVRSAERVICVSRFTAEEVQRLYGADPESIRVIAPAPALPVGTASPPPGRYLLGVGDLRMKKNWPTLVRAWLRLRADGLPHRLVLAGADLGEGAGLQALAGDAPLELTGYVDDNRLDALLRGADVLVHPSRYEGFGLVVVEAMARGCPVIAASGSGLQEAGGDAARYADPADPAAFAIEIAAVLGDSGERERRVAAGRARAAGLSWARTAEQTAAVYRELC
ncbi:MAG: glycosyltransferase family 4 protein [Solirubrobacteraceae bacterium]